MSATSTVHAQLGKANSPSLTAEFPAQEKTKSTSLKIETLSQCTYVSVVRAALERSDFAVRRLPLIFALK